MPSSLSYPSGTQGQPQYRYRLMQLPAEVAQLFDNGVGSGLLIRGGEDCDAILTTESSSYAVKEVQTSNTLLLVHLDPHSAVTSDIDIDTEIESSSHPYTVEASLSSVVELENVVPKSIDQLTQLLGPSTYSGPYHEKKRMQGTGPGADAVLYSWEELRGLVQASDLELKTALAELGAVEFEGSFRLIEEKDMLALTEDEALHMMAEHDIPETVILHCLHLISDEVGAGSGIFRLSSSKICRTTGTEVLVAMKHKTLLSAFMQEWRRATPSAFEPNLNCLQGLYLLEENSAMNNEIKYFPKSKLPSIAKDRLEHLFQVRRKWASTDIMPYIQDLAENKKKLDLMLLKYARLSKVGETVYYSSRFG
ncbi:sister chromatid cohesion protein Dcc1 [Obelidium mucronatum]|nr:sister chromatid cohesion protein Dcc1 [Obelidium mucronatum]